MSIVLFDMWTPRRERLIREHSFYVEQARLRLLSQFEDIEKEAEKFSEDWCKQQQAYFDPERHDEYAFYEQAEEEGLAHYQMLDDMRNRTRLSVVSGMYFEWDKQLRDFLISEISHWCRKDAVKDAVWRCNFDDLMDLLKGIGFDVKTLAFYDSLNKCRFVVNAYKHGDGGAFKEIQNKYPEFIDSAVRGFPFVEFSNHADLIVTEEQIEEFSRAIIDFWQAFPERIWNEDSISVPEWFAKAMKKDDKTSL